MCRYAMDVAMSCIGISYENCVIHVMKNDTMAKFKASYTVLVRSEINRNNKQTLF